MDRWTDGERQTATGSDSKGVREGRGKDSRVRSQGRTDAQPEKPRTKHARRKKTGKTQ